MGVKKTSISSDSPRVGLSALACGQLGERWGRVAFTKDGATLVSFTADSEHAAIWDRETGKHLFGSDMSRQGGLLSPDGRFLASCQTGGNAHEVQVLSVFTVRSGLRRSVATGHSGRIAALAWAPDGETLATGSQDKTVKLWNAVDGTEIATLCGHPGSLIALAWKPDGKTLGALSEDGTLKLWEAARRVETGTLTLLQGDVRALRTVRPTIPGTRDL
jgi:WD40 repeat protein